MIEETFGLLVAPTEPSSLRALASRISTVPESYGVDFFWHSAHGPEGQESVLSWGIQRKEINDFVSSVHDGRLGKELQQGQQLDRSVLLIEGEPKWTNDGMLARSFGATFSRRQWSSLLLSIQFSTDWRLCYSKDIGHTEWLIPELVAWSRKSEHLSFLRRPKEKSPWGSADSRDYQIFMLQSVPGVGPKMAAKIIDSLGGSPYDMRVSEEDLLSIDGVGPRTAKAIAAAVGPMEKKRRKKRKASK